VFSLVLAAAGVVLLAGLRFAPSLWARLRGTHAAATDGATR